MRPEISIDLQNLKEKSSDFFSVCIDFHLGGIQQLRGQEEGEGVSQKSTLVHPGRGGPFNVHVDQNLDISESISYHSCIIVH